MLDLSWFALLEFPQPNLCTSHLKPLTPGMAGTFTQCECESQWKFPDTGAKLLREVKSQPLGTRAVQTKVPCGELAVAAFLKFLSPDLEKHF